MAHFNGEREERFFDCVAGRPQERDETTASGHSAQNDGLVVVHERRRTQTRSVAGLPRWTRAAPWPVTVSDIV